MTRRPTTTKAEPDPTVRETEGRPTTVITDADFGPAPNTSQEPAVPMWRVTLVRERGGQQVFTEHRISAADASAAVDELAQRTSLSRDDLSVHSVDKVEQD